MLVLSRRKDEAIVIGDNIRLMVLEVRGDKVRLGIDAPRDVPVHREEIAEAIAREEQRNKPLKFVCQTHAHLTRPLNSPCPYCTEVAGGESDG